MADANGGPMDPGPGPAETVEVAVMGMGPIGQEILRVLADRPWAEIVAAVDVDPELQGADAGELSGLDRPLGVEVTGALEGDCDVVAHATVSGLAPAADQVEPLLDRGISVVSTCEEMSCPLDEGIAERLHHAAREGGATLLGTGINPGYLLDALPASLTVACQDVREIEATRIVDAAERREPLQRKVGAGLDLEEWAERKVEGRIRHVGLPESARLLAAAVGWDDVQYSDELIEPVRAEGAVSTEFLEVEAGQAAGLRQLVTGSRNGREVLRLELQMYVGARHPRDSVTVRGTPPVKMVIEGGIHGDRGTAAVVVNMIPRTRSAPSGFRTMAELPLGASL